MKNPSPSAAAPNSSFPLAMGYIKAIASLLVITTHVTGDLIASAPTQRYLFFTVFLNSLTAGSVGVFTLLSGYGLTRKYIKEPQIRFGRFFKERVVKLLVPYLLWSCFYLWLRFKLFEIPLDWEIVWPKLVYGNSAYHMYYIFIIFQLYLLFIPLLKGMRRFGAPKMVLLALAVSLLAAVHYLVPIDQPGFKEWVASIGRQGDLEYYLFLASRTFPTYLFYFVLGMGLALDPRLLAFRRFPLAVAGVYLLAGANRVLGQFTTIDPSIQPFYPLGYNIAYIFYSVSLGLLLIVLTDWLRKRATWPLHRFLERLGMMSQTTYYLHPAVLYLANAWIAKPLTHNRLLQAPLFYAGIVSVSLFLSYAISLPRLKKTRIRPL